MSILIALLVGAAIGYGIGKFLPPGANFIFISTFVGIAGSILGMAMYYLFLVGAAKAALVSLGGILSMIVGALIAVGIFVFIHVLTVGETDDPI